MALSDFMSSQVGTILYKTPADLSRNVFPVPFTGVNYDELARQKVSEMEIRKQFLTDPYSQARLNMLNPLSLTPEDVIEGHIKTNMLQELVATQYKLFKGAEKFASGFTSSKAKAVAMAIYSQMKVNSDYTTIENQIASYISKGDITETEARRLRILVSQRLSHPELFEDRNELKRQRELEKLILEITHYLSMSRGISNADPHARKVAMEAVAVALQEMLARGKPFERTDIGMLKRLAEREVLSMFDNDILERATEVPEGGVMPTVGVQPMPEVGASSGISISRAPVRGWQREADLDTIRLDAEEVRRENRRRPVLFRQTSFESEDIRPVRTRILKEGGGEGGAEGQRRMMRESRGERLLANPLLPQVPQDIEIVEPTYKLTGTKVKIGKPKSKKKGEVIFERQRLGEEGLGLPRGRPTREVSELMGFLGGEKRLLEQLEREGRIQKEIRPRGVEVIRNVLEELD
jgi:hypothetical protein